VNYLFLVHHWWLWYGPSPKPWIVSGHNRVYIRYRLGQMDVQLVQSFKNYFPALGLHHLNSVRWYRCAPCQHWSKRGTMIGCGWAYWSAVARWIAVAWRLEWAVGVVLFGVLEQTKFKPSTCKVEYGSSYSIFRKFKLPILPGEVQSMLSFR